MLKSALLCVALPAREPRGPQGPGSQPPHPGASPLQLPRQRKQQQKESPPPRPLLGPQPRLPSCPGYGKRSGQKTPRLHKCRPTFTLYTHTHAHTCTEAKNFLAALKRKGSTGEAAGPAAAPFSHRRCRCHRSLPPQFRPPPPQPPPVPLLGLGPLQPLHPPRGWRWEGWGKKRKGGGVVGKSIELLPTWSSR